MESRFSACKSLNGRKKAVTLVTSLVVCFLLLALPRDERMTFNGEKADQKRIERE